MCLLAKCQHSANNNTIDNAKWSTEQLHSNTPRHWCVQQINQLSTIYITVSPFNGCCVTSYSICLQYGARFFFVFVIILSSIRININLQSCSLLQRLPSVITPHGLFRLHYLYSPPHPLVNPSLPSSRSHHPSLLHSFAPGSKPTFSANPSHLRLLLPTGLSHDNGTGLDLSRSSFYF